MKQFNIRNKCSINLNRDMDTFVGLKNENGDISVNFPLGYHISEKDVQLKKDILLLFATLAMNTKRKDSELLTRGMNYDDVEFPLQSYIYVIKDYMSRGYYKEQEITYNVSRRGKVNWNRTIKTQKMYIQDDDLFYLDFVTKRNTIKNDELISMIHEYIVYESFDKIGWLFTGTMPKSPRIKSNGKLFRSVIRDKLANTFNDENKRLFRHMLAIIEYQGDKDADKNYMYGTYRFEYIWEQMIDRVFGIDNKSDYFPKTTWKLNSGSFDNVSLVPDTIMIYDNNVYILDAKYYKYGITERPCDLPESTSINKQITYGEYVATESLFKQIHGEYMEVYNAFIMPFDSLKQEYPNDIDMIGIGEAVSNWKDNTKEYEKIKGILVDVKKLMNISVRQEESEIMKLAELIERS